MYRFIVFLALLLAGCTRDFTVPAPALYSEESNPYSSLPEDAQTNELRVFYATDREMEAKAKPAKRYNGTRAKELRVGQATVRLGKKGLSWAQVQSKTLNGPGLKSSIVGVEDFGVLGGNSKQAARRFVAALDKQLGYGRGDVFVFVPGYNTSFEWPVTIGGQYRHYTGRQGVFVSYCWPARGGMFTYPSDLVTARHCIPRFRALLDLIAQSKARKIHLLGYSCGAMMVVEVLAGLVKDKSAAARRTLPRLGHVIYAGADVSLARFRSVHLAPGAAYPARYTLYTHGGDDVLGLARLLYAGGPRAGRANGDLTKADLDHLRAEEQSAYIDVGNAVHKAGGGLMDHQYFHQNGWVMTDLLLATFYGLRPAGRGLVRESGESLWRFPDNYLERVRTLARKHRFFLGQENKIRR